MPRPRMDAHQVTASLLGVTYPARRWQLLAQADYYGADVDTQVELARLPDLLYSDLAGVISAIAAGLAARATAPLTPRP